MDQVSRPLQVALLLTVALAALWLVVLRPRSEEAPAPPPARTTSPHSAIPGGPGKALDNARAGADRASAGNAARSERVDAAAGGQAGSTRAGGAAPSSAAPTLSSPGGVVTVTGGPVARGASPSAVNRALARGKAVVVLFYGRGADDAQVRRELDNVGRRGGRVVVFRAAIADVSRFGSLTQGVRVLESPTVVVAGPAGRGRALMGYSHATEIDQAVNSVLR